jgi:uncharacterized protein YjiS (DUF1127 family)
MRKRKLYLGAIRHGRLTKNQVSLKSKSSFGQSLSGMLESNVATDKAHLGISIHVRTNQPIEPMSSYQLRRWARQERSVLMASYLQSVAIYLATSLGDCARYFGKLARRGAHELYLRHATQTLQQFDDRILADIGLRRAEIEHAVRNGRLATRRWSQIGRGTSNVTLLEPFAPNRCAASDGFNLRRCKTTTYLSFGVRTIETKQHRLKDC